MAASFGSSKRKQGFFLPVANLPTISEMAIKNILVQFMTERVGYLFSSNFSPVVYEERLQVLAGKKADLQTQIEATQKSLKDLDDRYRDSVGRAEEHVVMLYAQLEAIRKDLLSSWETDIYAQHNAVLPPLEEVRNCKQLIKKHNITLNALTRQMDIVQQKIQKWQQRQSTRFYLSKGELGKFENFLKAELKKIHSPQTLNAGVGSTSVKLASDSAPKPVSHARRSHHDVVSSPRLSSAPTTPRGQQKESDHEDGVRSSGLKKDCIYVTMVLQNTRYYLEHKMQQLITAHLSDKNGSSEGMACIVQQKSLSKVLDDIARAGHICWLDLLKTELRQLSAFLSSLEKIHHTADNGHKNKTKHSKKKVAEADKHAMKEKELAATCTRIEHMMMRWVPGLKENGALMVSMKLHIVEAITKFIKKIEENKNIDIDSTVHHSASYLLTPCRKMNYFLIAVSGSGQDYTRLIQEEGLDVLKYMKFQYELQYTIEEDHPDFTEVIAEFWQTFIDYFEKNYILLFSEITAIVKDPHKVCFLTDGLSKVLAKQCSIEEAIIDLFKNEKLKTYLDAKQAEYASDCEHYLHSPFALAAYHQPESQKIYAQRISRALLKIEEIQQHKNEHVQTLQCRA